MPLVIDYPLVLSRLSTEGLRCNYHNSGSFGFPRGVKTSIRGWIGPADLTIRTPNGTVTVPVAIRRVAPAVFEGAIFHSDGTQVSAEAPARAGQTLRVYLTGLGAASGAVAGEASKQTPVLASVTVRWNSESVTPGFAGLSPGSAGVNVVSFQVPPGARGRASLQIVADGSESNPVAVPAA